MKLFGPAFEGHLFRALGKLEDTARDMTVAVTLGLLPG